MSMCCQTGQSRALGQPVTERLHPSPFAWYIRNFADKPSHPCPSARPSSKSYRPSRRLEAPLLASWQPSVVFILLDRMHHDWHKSGSLPYSRAFAAINLFFMTAKIHERTLESHPSYGEVWYPQEWITSFDVTGIEPAYQRESRADCRRRVIVLTLVRFVIDLVL